MAKNRLFRYDAKNVVRAGTSRSRGPESEPETVRTGTASATEWLSRDAAAKGNE
jgi:hypothetical protein